MKARGAWLAAAFGTLRLAVVITSASLSACIEFVADSSSKATDGGAGADQISDAVGRESQGPDAAGEDSGDATLDGSLEADGRVSPGLDAAAERGDATLDGDPEAAPDVSPGLVAPIDDGPGIVDDNSDLSERVSTEASPPNPPDCGLFASPQVLTSGQSFISCDLRFKLTLQSDGDLVLRSGDLVLWSTQTSGKEAQALVMEAGGDFVLYDVNNLPIWSSGTLGHPGAYVELQSDGNLVVYNVGPPGVFPLWSSGDDQAPQVPLACGVISYPQGLYYGNTFRSCDGRFALKVQADGHVALLLGSATLWSSPNSGTYGWEALMQADGDFAVYDYWTRIWDTGTGGNPGASLLVQNDGNLVVSGPDGGALWTSGTGGH